MFIQVGSTRSRALFGFGLIAEIYEKHEGETPVDIRYIHPIFNWPLIGDARVRSFLRGRAFQNSTLKKRLTFQTGAQGLTYLSLGEKDRMVIQEMLETFKPESVTQDEWNSILLSLSADKRTKILREVEQRVGQEAVRGGADKNYPAGCALCKPNVKEAGLLVAAHIKRWSKSTRY